MIRIFFFILFFAGIIGKAQFTNNHPFSSQHTLETALGGLKVNRGFINTYYADTTAANLQPIATYSGSQFFSNDTLYIRNKTATKWLAFYVGSGGGGAGSVTDFLFTDGNGVDGTVTLGTSTPTLSLAFTPVGILKSNGTTMSAAVLGTDYSLINGVGFVKANGTTLSYDNSVYSSTASEGLSMVAGDTKLGGTIASPSYFSTERVVSTNRSIMHWTNGVLPTSGGPSFLPSFPLNINWSPFQFISSDTVTANDLAVPSINVPHSGVYASRQIYYADGIIRNQKMFGHNYQTLWNWKDTFSLDTRGGDYNTGFKVENMYRPRGTGRQGIRASHGTGQDNSIYYAAPALLVNTFLDNQAGNYIKVNGHLSGVNSYLIMSTVNPDTIAKFVAYTTGAFLGTGSNIGIAYDFAPGSPYVTGTFIDSSYGWFDTARVKRWYHANKTVIGPSRGSIHPWSSSDQLKVIGNVNITDSLLLGKAAEVVDTTGYDIVLRKRTDGSIFRIRADLLGGGSLLPTTGTGIATGAVIGSLAGNTLSVNQGANSFLSIDPTSGAETVTLRAYNTTNDDNYGRYLATTSNTQSSFQIQSSFNGGVKESTITGSADVTVSAISYASGTHSFTGSVGMNMAGTILANRALTVQNGIDDVDLLHIDIEPNAEHSIIQAYNTANVGSSFGYFEAQTTDAHAQFDLQGDFNGSTEVIRIIGQATALTGFISYQADTHTFTGNILTATNNTYDIGDATNSFKDIYSRTLKLDGSTSGTITFASDALANAPNATTLSGTGYVPATMFSRLTSNFTMSDVNTVQPVFSTGQDVWTLQASTTYYFEGTYYLTHAAVSHSVGMSFELGGGASLTSIFYQTICWVTAANTNTASQTTNLINQATNTSVNAAGANAQETIKFWGWMSVNAGGTVTPSITFSAAPGGTPAAVAGTYITFTPIGTNTVTSLGNVN